MASVLVSSIITEFRYTFPDCDATLALTLFNRVHGDLLEMLPLKVTQEDITLTAADYEYSLNERTLKIWSADYLRSATDVKRLIEVDYERYNRETPNWRVSPQGEPSQYSIWRSGVTLGLYCYPVPQTTTSGGYPIIRLDVSRTEELLSSEYTPVGLGSADIYFTGMCKRYARIRKRDEYKFWSEQFTEELKRERDTWDSRAVQTPPSVTPSWLPRSYVV